MDAAASFKCDLWKQFGFSVSGDERTGTDTLEPFSRRFMDRRNEFVAH